ncbi:MAG: TatD family hydrolase [Bacteroidales bacterium]|nr:TatD family hydrolase [Bacteroidales bacterium]
MRVIDSHSHLYLEQFKSDLPEVIARAKGVGIEKILLPNVDDTTISSLLEMCSIWSDYCYPMMGLHPTSVKKDYLLKLKTVKKELDRNLDRYIGVGEIGLDFYWDKTFIREQKKALIEQLNWAVQYDLPVVIHCREAFSDIFEVLEEFKELPLRGVFHSFTGTKEELLNALSYESFYIGINGIVTFKNASLSELIPFIPTERLLLETDAPYLAPVPMRGKRNESSFLIHTLMKVASCYSIGVDDLGIITIKNTKRLFGKLE